MEGLFHSRNERVIRRALATGLLGMTSSDFQHWQDNPEAWDKWVGVFRECNEAWRKSGIYVALHELFRKTRAIPKNLRRPDGERRVTNFLHLTEVLHRATTQNPLSAAPFCWSGSGPEWNKKTVRMMSINYGWNRSQNPFGS